MLKNISLKYINLENVKKINKNKVYSQKFNK